MEEGEGEGGERCERLKVIRRKDREGGREVENENEKKDTEKNTISLSAFLFFLFFLTLNLSYSSSILIYIPSFIFCFSYFQFYGDSQQFCVERNHGSRILPDQTLVG